MRDRKNRQIVKRTGSTLLGVVLAAALAVSPAGPVYAEEESGIPDPVESAIGSLLSSGNYREGEAIALVRNGASVAEAGEAEVLAEVDAEAVEETAEEAAETAEEELPAAEEAEARLLASGPDPESYTVLHVVDQSRTTEEILRDLYSSPDVIAAEPNYIIEETASEEGDLFLTDPENAAETEDLTAEDLPAEGAAEDAAEAEEPAAEEPAETEAEEPAGTEAETADPEEAETEAEDPADPENEPEDPADEETQIEESAEDAGVESDPAAAETENPEKEDPADNKKKTERENKEEAEENDQEETALKEPVIDPDPIYVTEPIGIGGGDLTPLEWYMADTGLRTLLPYSPSDGYTMNVPGWAEGRTDENAPANASGTVCIMDSGLDVTHPDLQNVLYEFSEEQQARLGCGPYGRNASGDRNPLSDVVDISSHGTHCAGIIAAQWNGFGTSGVANGVKLFAVRIFGVGGTSDEASVVEGFAFLVKAAKEVNLKAVNCSWGTTIPQFIYTVMINALGKQGVNTVFASGNRGVDLDENIDNGGAINSIYKVTIDAAMPNGQISDFSCYGQSSTDVFVPGVSMLSTFPVRMEVVERIYDYNRFFPEATGAEDLVFGTERFTDNNRTVRLFTANPALTENAKEFGRSYVNIGYDDERSMAVNVAELRGGATAGDVYTMNGSVYLAIPVTSAGDAKWISAAVAMSDAFKPSSSMVSVTAADAGGNPVEVDSTCVKALNKGYDSAASYNIYQSQWSTFSLNVQGYLDASNEIHQYFAEGKTAEDLSGMGIDGLDGYQDIGEVSGLYEWIDDGNRYIIARIGLGPESAGSVSAGTTLYIDNVGVGSAGAYTGAYVHQSGTSMAAPAACGCLAVIAKDEAPAWELSDEELEMQALERAAKLLASVDYDPSLEALCSTGGRVNLYGQTAFTAKAPIIKRAEVTDKVLTIDGYFFGEGGQLYVDGAAAAASSWSDTCITADVSMIDNGSHVVKIINSDGAVRQCRFSYSEENTAGRQLYERTHSLPFTEPEFAEEKTDRIFGSAAEAGGCIYAFSASGAFENLDGLWKYDIGNDKWTACTLPEGLKGQQCDSKDLISLNGVLYLYGSVAQGRKEPIGRLWRYDPSGGTWSSIELDIPSDGKLCVYQNRILIIDGSFRGFEDRKKYQDVKFSLVDPEKKTLTTLSGSLPGVVADRSCTAAASNEKAYFFYNKLDEEDNESYVFVRLTIDTENLKVTTEDLTPAFTKALGGDACYWKTRDHRGLSKHVTLEGLPNGVAIIGSAKAGTDTHIIYDNAADCTEYEKTSCYHTPQEQIAVYADEWLYVMGYNATEPDVMYFRSTHAAEEERTITDVKLKYSSMTYTGEARTQSNAAVVKAGTKVLKKGTDYKITYQNNTKVGKAVVTVTGKGKYSGTIRKSFKIVPTKRNFNGVMPGKEKVTLSWAKNKPEATGYQYQCSTDKDFTAIVKSGKMKIADVSTSSMKKTITKLTSGKTYYVRIRAYAAVGDANYYSKWSAVTEVRVK